MSMLLNEALLELSLKPGERRHVMVQDQEFEIRCLTMQFVDDGPMVNIPFNPPLPPDAIIRVVPISEAPKLRPMVITESDLAPE